MSKFRLIILSVSFLVTLISIVLLGALKVNGGYSGLIFFLWCIFAFFICIVEEN